MVGGACPHDLVGGACPHDPQYVLHIAGNQKLDSGMEQSYVFASHTLRCCIPLIVASVDQPGVELGHDGQ